MSKPKNPPLADLVAIMARLRDPATGCPWDVEQSFRTIAPYTIEEAYEVADAIERDDMDALKDELGDLLLQVVFHARMAEEAGHFDVSDVIAAICDKMIRRHPHVFSDVEASDGNTVLRNWESIKAGERAAKSTDNSALAGVASALPALLRAEKLQKRAARVGFDWPDAAGPRAKIMEELDEVAGAASFNDLEDEIGDLIFAAVNLARHMKIDPETALRRANLKFETRFRSMEMRVGDRFSSLSPEAKEALWIEAKADERT